MNAKRILVLIFICFSITVGLFIRNCLQDGFSYTQIDDTEYLQGLINEASNSGNNTLEIESHTYHIYKPLVVPSGMRLSGDNRSNTKIVSHGNIPTIVTSGYYDPKQESSNIVIERMTFEPRDVSRSNHYTVEMVNTFNSTINNIHISAPELDQSSVFGVNFSKKQEYKGNHFINRIENSQFSNASIRMESTDSYIQSNEVWGHTRSFAIHLVKSSQFVTNNQIVGSTANGGVFIKDDIDNSPVELIRISGNYFDGSYDKVKSGVGIIADKVNNSRIVNNDFWRQTDEAIRIGNSTSIIINSNNFTNNSRDGNKSDIYLYDSSNSVIQGNTFSRSKGYKGTQHIIEIGEKSKTNVINSNTILNE